MHSVGNLHGKGMILVKHPNLELLYTGHTRKLLHPTLSLTTICVVINQTSVTNTCMSTALYVMCDEGEKSSDGVLCGDKPYYSLRLITSDACRPRKPCSNPH